MVLHFQSPSRLRNSERYRHYRRRKRLDVYQKELSASPGHIELERLIEEITRGDLDAQSDSLFLLSFREFCENVRSLICRTPPMIAALRRLLVPEEIFAFEIHWFNQYGEPMAHKAWRVHYCSALGPCRGGIRFHQYVTLDIVKALAFEVTIQNALLNMPMGGSFTGSNFDARNASDEDVINFCRAFCLEIRKSIDPQCPLDITTDMGCGVRECTILEAAHQTLINASSNLNYPAVVGRPAASGLGAVEFGKRMLRLPSFDKTHCLISGAGDCALTVARNLIVEGARVLTLSDSSGFIYCPEGITFGRIQRISDYKRARTPLQEIVSNDGWLKDLRWHSGSVWEYGIKGDYAFPCSYEMEIDTAQAQILVNQSKVKAVIEVSYMATTSLAVKLFFSHKVQVVPAKAANCGAMVALGMNLSEQIGKAEFEHRLKTYMQFVHDQIRCIYDEFYPDIMFREAVDMCALLRLAKAMRELGQI